ncbi:MAG: hypothetical protein IBJ18_12840 [Phycisphaerales bacterium]|nr:hypothetical protein [Phycisphaerales bacterium]
MKTKQMNGVSVLALTLAASVLMLGGCQTGGARSASEPSQMIVAPATKEQKAALLDQVKALAGTWEGRNDKGEVTSTHVFSVSSAGNAVREVMFPGSPHEMTNMYHMNGSRLMMTHYCAVGNQPRMMSTSDSTPGKIVMKFDSVTNNSVETDHCMGNMTLEIVSKDVIRQHWSGWEKGQPTEKMVFELKRKK